MYETGEARVYIRSLLHAICISTWLHFASKNLLKLRLGGVLGSRGASWGPLGASWARLGASGAHLGASWRRLGASWARLGASSGEKLRPGRVQAEIMLLPDQGRTRYAAPAGPGEA